MDIIDLELSACQEELPLKLINLTRTRQSLSLFDIVIEKSDDELKETVYEEKLKDEVSEWFKLAKQAKSQLDIETESKNVNEIDKSILTPDQTQYLEKMPNIQEFIEDSAVFQKKAYNYLQHYNETIEMKDELAKYCIEKLEKITVNNFEKYICE